MILALNFFSVLFFIISAFVFGGLTIVSCCLLFYVFICFEALFYRCIGYIGHKLYCINWKKELPKLIIIFFSLISAIWIGLIEINFIYAKIIHIIPRKFLIFRINWLDQNNVGFCILFTITTLYLIYLYFEDRKNKD